MLSDDVAPLEAIAVAVRTVPGEGTHVEIWMPVSLNVPEERDTHRVGM